MSSLIARLTKAKARLFGTAAQEVPVPFEVPCDCGHRVTGIRRTSYQIATCSACQSSIYILPVNVYPTNRRVRSEIVDGPVLNKVGTVMRDLVMGDQQASDPEASSDKTSEKRATTAPGTQKRVRQGESTADAENSPGTVRRKRRSEQEDADSGSPVPVEESLPSEPLIRIPRQSLSVRVKRAFTPTRLLAIAGVCILLTTGFWTVRQRQMEQARKIWRSQMDLADEALKKRDLGTLGEALATALKAADTLGRTDTEVRVAESLLRQTEAVQKISALDLVAVINGTLSDDRMLDPSKAQAAAESLRGQFVVFQAVLNPLAESQKELRLDFPLIVEQFSVDVVVSSNLLSRCVEVSPGQPVLFAAAIQNCQPPGPSQTVWRIELAGSSCCLITSELHAAQLGFDANTQTEISGLLERQTEFIRTEGIAIQETADHSEPATATENTVTRAESEPAEGQP